MVKIQLIPPATSEFGINEVRHKISAAATVQEEVLAKAAEEGGDGICEIRTLNIGWGASRR